MRLRAWQVVRLHARAWFRSAHAKLFLLTGLLTSLLTLFVAYTIIDNSRHEMLEYTKQLAIQTAQAVASQISERDDTFQSPSRIKAFLETMAGTDRSIDQIDVFRNAETDPTKVVLVTSSAVDEEVAWTPELGRFMATPEDGPTSNLIELIGADGAGAVSSGWEVYIPIPSPLEGARPIGLVRTYCDMERWETVWRNNLQRTYRILPLVLLGEFVLLWLILAWLLTRPLKTITAAMAKLEAGDTGARADIRRSDELGRIAERFNVMASQLERASAERESLILEIQGLNAGLQTRIDAALAELQGKNRDLEELLKRIAMLREELAQQERLAIAGQLTAAFAHEVGTPLNLVNSHLQLLLAQHDLGEKTRERVATIHTQITRVGDIVRKLLANTRRPEIQAEPIVLGELITDLQRLWSPTLSRRDIAFHMEAPSDCRLLVDRKQMEQLFINLVNNAVDALAPGGWIRLRVARDPGSTDLKPRWAVTVEDNGAGIPEDVLPLVFKPMFTTKPEGKGTGLGLAICREIVRAHGGELRITSTVGQGTALHFTLPGV